MVTGKTTESHFNAFHCFNGNSDEELHSMMKDYFKVESMGVKIVEDKIMSIQDHRVKQLMDRNTSRVNDRWETGLLWKTDDIVMPPSYDSALKRLVYLEKKMDKDPNLKSQYKSRMQYYFENGFARLLTPEEKSMESPRIWYLPHFGVYHPQKPGKVRLVFDAAKSNGISLNDQLLTGPDLLTSLPGSLIKFRQREIGITGDIKDFFHQVRLISSDIPAQRFLWRGDRRDGEPDIYVMTVNIFGATCCPFTSQEVRNRNALEFIDESPEAVKAITDRHYMDNYLDSCHSEEEAVNIIHDVIHIHDQGGFQIREFSCSSKNVLQHIPQELRATDKKELSFDDKMKSERVLGLVWNPNTDSLTFNMKLPRVDKSILEVPGSNPTKRQILRLVMSIFDPMGYLSPLTVQGKILLQDIWRSNLGWDDPLSEHLLKKWELWRNKLKPSIESFNLQRAYSFDMKNKKNIQLHMFCDGSQSAYCAVAYVRVETEEKTTSTIVMAKTRVAPLKPLSIPRMELQAALAGSRLAKFIESQMEIQTDKTYFWIDSATVMKWITTDARRYHTFISHRIGEILELTDAHQWHWISTKENVADEATRANSDIDLSPNSRWVNGPKFLCQPLEFWPIESMKNIKISNEQLEVRSCELNSDFVGVTMKAEMLIDYTRFSKWSRLIRSMAYVFRFIRNCKEKIKSRKIAISPYLSVEEIEFSKTYKSRRRSYLEGICLLKKRKPVQKTSQLKCLSPILDSDDIIRLGGRIDASTLVDEFVKRPIILDPSHYVTNRYVFPYPSRSSWT